MCVQSTKTRMMSSVFVLISLVDGYSIVTSVAVLLQNADLQTADQQYIPMQILTEHIPISRY